MFELIKDIPMLPDFVKIVAECKKAGEVYTYSVKPKFDLRTSKDLIIKGGKFYAMWDEANNTWTTKSDDVISCVDKAVEFAANRMRSENKFVTSVSYMWDADTGLAKKFYDTCACRDDVNIDLNAKLIFADQEIHRDDYATVKLPYSLAEGPTAGWDKLMSVLYPDTERHKIEWAIGSILSGDSVELQKFYVFYGGHGTGKSTVLHIMEELFKGYTTHFRAKEIGSSSNSFSLEQLVGNALVAIEHDGKLSSIEDNSLLNSVISHEMLSVNQKFKKPFVTSFKCTIFVGTNEPVKITDAKSGLIRRLIDIHPTGNTLTMTEYNSAYKQAKYELGQIAARCLKTYQENPHYYDKYVPLAMMSATNDIYDFVEENYFVFKDKGEITIKPAWDMYKEYVKEYSIMYPTPYKKFKEDLKEYFDEYIERLQIGGERKRGLYSGFRTWKFDNFSNSENSNPEPTAENVWLQFEPSMHSLLDDYLAEYPAQGCKVDGTPLNAWSNVRTKLADLKPTDLHYVNGPENLICIDFDKKKDGSKSFELNLAEALKWPPTYAELSKSGEGIHLHYIYTGDVNELSSVFDDDIEVKVYTGNQSLRRRLSKCNTLPIATISSGLPLKKKKMLNVSEIVDERHLRNRIHKNLRKENIPYTIGSVQLIEKDLEDAYEKGFHYDVSDLAPKMMAFALKSTNSSDRCLKILRTLKLKSADCVEQPVESGNDDTPMVFFDVEVFPNLLLVNWKVYKEPTVYRMINPSSEEVAKLFNYRLIGFNNRRYDNHILYARYLNYSIEQVYDLSKRIVSTKKGSGQGLFFGKAWNLSYMDLYDCASTKQSLKKWENVMHTLHKELGLDWNQPVPEELWTKVAEYCDNDVISTELLYDHIEADVQARLILADLADMTPNDTTNSLTTRIIFGDNREPQSNFNYRDMGDESQIAKGVVGYDKYTVFDKEGRPIFPGYKYDHGVSIYRDEEVGEGGNVWAKPGYYINVALLDIASMHPHSIIAEKLFGKYTKNFQDLVNARIYIKHKQYDKAGELFGGKLKKYLTDDKMAKKLSKALKIAINAVYGQTAAKYTCPFKDVRNVDNIVAKRGALFMVNLRHEVQKRGGEVIHIKTDSIKIANATLELIDFVMEYGKMYGYTFEHEATYDRICLVNDAVYIAKFATEEKCRELYGDAYVDSSPEIVPECKEEGGQWTATGKQFAVPYVFKTLFSKKPYEFWDFAEMKEGKDPMYLTDGEEKSFIGKVSLFCPVKENTIGKSLVKEVADKNGNVKYDAVVGTKGYLWAEAEDVKALNDDSIIDKTYYTKQATDAKEEISKYVDFEAFAAD